MPAVVTTPRFRRRFREQSRWLKENRSARLAERWERAAQAALSELAGMPESYSLAREEGLPRGPYRQHMFGAGKKPTHRLVFRVEPGQVVVEAVRGLSQDDLTAADL